MKWKIHNGTFFYSFINNFYSGAVENVQCPSCRLSSLKLRIIKRPGEPEVNLRVGLNSNILSWLISSNAERLIYFNVDVLV